MRCVFNLTYQRKSHPRHNVSPSRSLCLSLSDTRALQHPDKQREKLRALLWVSEPMNLPGPHQRSPLLLSSRPGTGVISPNLRRDSLATVWLRRGTWAPMAPAATHQTLPQPAQGCPVAPTDHQQQARSGQRHASTHDQVRTFTPPCPRPEANAPW